MSNSKDKQYLLVGIDPGNSDTKASFLNLDGSISEFSIPTCYAPAPTERSVLNQKRSKENILPTEHLHVEIIPSNGAFPRGTYWIGTAAKLSKSIVEPTDEPKPTSEVHLMTAVVAEAIAALQNGLTGDVHVPPSFGLPINDVKNKQSSVFLNRLKGSFKITFLDGAYAGETVTIIHEINEDDPVETYIHAEAIKAPLGIGFDIKDFKDVETELADLVVGDIVVSDPGGKTFDVAVYSEDDVNAFASTTYLRTPENFSILSETEELVGKPLGANYYIDMALELSENEIRKQLQENDVPILTNTFFSGRNDFINKVLKPYTIALQDYYDKIKKNEKQKTKDMPRITINEVGLEIDLTEVLIPLLTTYGNIIHYMNLLARQERGASHIKNNIIIGGGVLLGYGVLREKQISSSGRALYHLPKNVVHSPFINSRAYLIDMFLGRPDIVKTLKNASK